MRERNETAYNLVLQINEIKPEQWDQWDEQDYRRIDAALRRAKAEGVREAARLVADDTYSEAGALLPDWEHRMKHNVNQKELAAKLDARAAQIEEGE